MSRPQPTVVNCQLPADILDLRPAGVLAHDIYRLRSNRALETLFSLEPTAGEQRSASQGCRLCNGANALPCPAPDDMTTAN